MKNTPVTHNNHVVIIDIDGTVAIHDGRGPFDERRVGWDAPNEPVIAVIESLAATGYGLVFVSGRTEGCREDTQKWLSLHINAPVEALFMRAMDDNRQDAIVKTEIYHRHIADQYKVLCVFDDRDQTVDAWRELGLTCMQVAEGNF